MCFHVRLTLTDIHEKPGRSVIALGDTIVIKGAPGDVETPVLVLTSGIQKKYSEISYSLSV
jgi:hypothetical protein